MTCGRIPRCDETGDYQEHNRGIFSKNREFVCNRPYVARVMLHEYFF
jgi:hypothetical protein